MDVFQSGIRFFSNLVGAWYGQEFWLTRFVFLRALGCIYLVAFLGVFNQYKGLFGDRGLLPANQFLQRIHETYGSALKAFLKLPSLFWIHISDQFMAILAFVGIIISAAVVLGVSNGVSLFILWVLYMSFVHVGQVFYGYGWESLLLEIGFLAIFLYPFFNLSLFPQHHPPPKLVMFLLIWVLFRNMFGAGLIKLRGDSCWRDLTCLNYHFETQPLPNPLSPFFHRLPNWMLKGGVLFNHFVELVVPFGMLLTAPFRIVAGVFTALFQLVLIVSGNLSWLNWLTLVICIPCFDDRVWRMILPSKLLSIVPNSPVFFSVYSLPNQLILVTLGLLIALLSIKPIQNLFSSRQAMNRSYDPFHLVNSYGAFGSVGKERFECVIKGTNNIQEGNWQEYDFIAKPGQVTRPHPIIAPYQPRLDWQIWFAAMGSYQHNPWLVHLVYKLLKNDDVILPLIYNNPFAKKPPKFVKIDLYRYEFSDSNQSSKVYWKRSFVRSYLPPLSVDNPSLIHYLKNQGWL